MTKGLKRKNFKKEDYIIDKAIIKFISEHSKKKTIDISKINISPFLNWSKIKREKKKIFIYKKYN